MSTKVLNTLAFFYSPNDPANLLIICSGYNILLSFFFICFDLDLPGITVTVDSGKFDFLKMKM